MSNLKAQQTTGLAQWVVPAAKKRKVATGPKQVRENFENISYRRDGSLSPTNSNSTGQSNNTLAFNDSSILESSILEELEDDQQQQQLNQRYSNNNRFSSSNNKHKTVAISHQICQTISTFVEAHLDDLTERQNLINQSKSMLSLPSNCELNPLLIAQKDLVRLKVRNEQTKAIGTIKQLNNYLRECSHIKCQSELGVYLVDDETSNRLSVLRTNIIQALNDFVLMNSDLDIPLDELDELNPRDYDFCTDVITTSSSSDASLISASQRLPGRRPRRGQAMLSSSSWSNCDSSLRDGNSIETRVSSLVDISEESDGFEANSLDLSKQKSTNNVKQQQQQSKLINLQTETELFERRRREIERLERDTGELRQLFTDFYSLIESQGGQVNSIEENIILAHSHINEGHHHLNKAIKSLAVLLPVTGCITGALIGGPLGLLVGGKVGGITIGCASSLIGLLSSVSAQRLCSDSASSSSSAPANVKSD